MNQPTIDQMPTLAVYATKYLREHPNTEQPINPCTMRRYESVLKLHILPALGSLPLSEITTETVEKWRASLNPDKQTTNRHAQSLVCTLLSQAVRENIIPTNPCTGKKVQPPREPVIVTVEMVAGIAQAMPDRLRMAVLLAAGCGLRIREVCALNVEDITDDRSMIHVRHEIKKHDRKETVEAMTRPRDVPVPESLRDGLAEHVSNSALSDLNGFLFTAPNGASMITLHNAFIKACATVPDCEDVSFSDLRHFALTETGTGILTLMKKEASII